MKDKITSLQYSTLTFFLLNSFLMNVGYNKITSISYNDSIIDVLIGGIGIVFMGIAISKIHSSYDGSIIDLIKKRNLFIRILLSIIIFILISITSIYTLQILTSFINYYVVKEVSFFTISLTLTITILYIVKKGIASISKISEIFFYIYLLIMVLGLIGLLKYIDLSNLKPLFTTNINNHFKSSFIYFLSSICPFFLLLIIPSNKIGKYKNHKTYTFLFILFSILLTFLQLIIIISTLGINLTNIYQNPDMIVYKKISFLNVLERVEVLLSLSNILNSLFIIILSVYLLKELLNGFFNRKKEHIILALLGILLIIFTNTLSFDYKIYLLINFSLLIGLILVFMNTIIHKHKH